MLSPAVGPSEELVSKRASVSSKSTLPSELVSIAPNTAMRTASGAFWPVTDSMAALNSSGDREPSPLRSYFEKSASAEMPFLRRTSCRFLIAIASMVPRAPSIMARERALQQ